MNSEEYKKFLEAYSGIYEQVGVQVPGKDPEDVLTDIIKDPKYGGGKVIKTKETKPSPSSSLVKAAEEYTVYDEVLDYLLSEGYTEEESNQIMVDFVTEGGIAKGLGALVKFVQKRASTPLKTAATDVATTALSLGGTPTGAKLSTTAARAASPTPLVRTVKAPTARTAPKGANIAPDPWKQPSAPRTSKPSTSPARTASTPKALTGSPTPKALTGTQVRPALPSGAKGGPLAKTTPAGALATRESRAPRGAKPTLNRQALPQPKATVEPGGKLATTRSAKPSFKPEALPQPKATVEPGGKLATKTPKTGLSPEGQAIQRLNKMTGGGPLGSRELPKTPHKAPKPAWGTGSSAKPATVKPAAKSPTQSVVDKAITQKSTKPATKPAIKLSGGSTGSTKGLKGLMGPATAGAALGVAADMAFPTPTAPGTRDISPKLPTSSKEVKKGETYYDYGTRIGTSQRPAARKKVGSKIVGPGKVGTEAQSFDKAYGAAKAKSGMGSTFKWKGKDYKVT